MQCDSAIMAGGCYNNLVFVAEFELEDFPEMNGVIPLGSNAFVIAF